MVRNLFNIFEWEEFNARAPRGQDAKEDSAMRGSPTPHSDRPEVSSYERPNQTTTYIDAETVLVTEIGTICTSIRVAKQSDFRILKTGDLAVGSRAGSETLAQQRSRRRSRAKPPRRQGKRRGKRAGPKHGAQLVQHF